MQLRRILGLGLGLSLCSVALADAKTEVFAAWDAMFAASSYRANIHASSGDQHYEQTIEIQLPDRIHMRGGPGGDVIVTPEGAWMKPPGGNWSVAPESTAALSKQFMSQEFVAQTKASVTAVEALGSESLRGQPVRVYRIEQTQTILGIKSTSTIKLYVDIGSGRPIRQEIDANAMGRDSRTVQDIEYVDTLQIKPPM